MEIVAFIYITNITDDNQYYHDFRSAASILHRLSRRTVFETSANMMRMRWCFHSKVLSDMGRQLDADLELGRDVIGKRIRK